LYRLKEEYPRHYNKIRLIIRQIAPFFDEPELGLHPVAIDKLASLLIILKLRILLSFQEKKRLEI
jgi:hypothetical protein